MKKLMLRKSLIVLGIGVVNGMFMLNKMDAALAGITLNGQDLTGHHSERAYRQSEALEGQRDKGLPDNGTSLTGHSLKGIGHQGVSLNGQVYRQSSASYSQTIRDDQFSIQLNERDK